MPYIHSVSCAFPPHYYDQDTLIDALKSRWSAKFFNPSRLETFHRNVLVGGRHLALPVEEYDKLEGFGGHNDAWIRVGLDVAERATNNLLQQADISPEDINLLVSNTVTGISVPSLEARLMNKISFSPYTKRLPILGLGCLAGVAGINRVCDYLEGHPKEAAIFFSVELCSLTLQRQDLSIPNIISSGLFGDGGAAVLLVGDEHPLRESSPFEVCGWRSVFFPDTERIMGWDMVDSGFKIVLSSKVPDIVSNEMPRAVADFLQDYNTQKEQLEFYVAHPGGPKVLKAMEEALDLKPDDLKYSWDCLQKHGNMSSVSVLFVLEALLKSLPAKDSLGLMTAMGPAFCSELGLIRCCLPQ
ncbi:type III polyketide synthase [Candidatus Uabimicrobium amorphum]|uniref:Stilbene synthase n=1 Tax=Uabimicrobium amorphum TaxID=2596890 RepID=A0A5S9IKH5_UABAM|nr:type III polyketide synthase [Candidatus Uabimicrobium amorphum]BBM83207.1 stilbene synthase [Candidatus Uabimicrobium amorphum]